MRYRVKAEHPRRPGQPLGDVTTKDGTVVASSGDVIDSGDLPEYLLASMLANGYLEPVTEPVKPEGGSRA